MNVRHIFRIASITFEENYRKKFLYILLFLSGVIILSSYFFDPFEIGQQLPVIIDVSLTSLSAFAIIMTFGLFLTAIPSEIEKKTIYPLMSKPINRSDYLWGKYMGNMAMIFINILVLSVLLFFLLSKLTHNFVWAIFNSVLLTFIECGMVGAIIVFFSPWMSYPVNMVLTMLFYLVGNLSQGYIEYLAADSKTHLSAGLALVLKFILPNFEYMHIKNSVVHSYIVDPFYIRGAAIYGILYILIVMLLADLLFRKKDL
jgi:ABC-type transport system involved in multi-copper enzyme maturation permease subunit